eukprot:Nitzschia sp. Nitz4//scaffold53_size117307//14224//17349//NITZ4_003755-RA/size117307-processed-gene-0.3-mRNA-1//1//CDS//3329554160//7394//frame0
MPTEKNRASGSLERELLRPSTHIPWSGDIHRIVPKPVFDSFADVQAACSGAGWAAVTTGDGYVQVWQPKTVALSDRLEVPAHSLKLFCNQLNVQASLSASKTLSPDHAIHMAISAGANTPTDLPLTPSSPSSSSNMGTSTASAINLFCYCQGWLILRKLTTHDLAQSKTGGLLKPSYPKLRVVLERDELGNLTEHVTSITAAPHFLVLATSAGNLHWVTLTPVPLSLHIQKIVPPSGWLSSMLFGSGSTRLASTASPYHVLPRSSTDFVALSQDASSLVHWKVTVPVQTAHHATFEPVLKASLALPAATMNLHPHHPPKILQATLAADHQTMHSILLAKTPQGESRMYWVQSSLDGTVLKTHWLARFSDPNSVIVYGVVAAENGSAYAAFYQATMRIVIVMALMPDNEVIQEVDIPPTHIPSLIPNMLELDTMTHGCSLLATSGLGLRVRCYQPETQPPSKRTRLTGPSAFNSAAVQTLVAHLRSSFWWAYQDHENQRPLPPSLHSASRADLEQTLLALATELQQKGDESSAQNPMEWHRALIKFYQERGLYRGLNQAARWELFSIGQELAAFGFIATHRNTFLDGPKAFTVGDWCLEQQQADGDSGWQSLLAGLLQTVMSYREDAAHPFYDILVGATPSQPVFLSQEPMQKVLLRQLEFWESHPSTMERRHLIPVVKAALQSYAEFYPDKDVHAKVQSLAIQLLRSLRDSPTGDEVDELAFDLCIEYKHFDGLCQIAVDHEKRRDAPNFSLDPLFTTLEGKDVAHGLTFPQFVLQWHTDKGLYGHTINYGRHAPADLSALMKQDERLRPYQWIPSIRQSLFDQATDSLIANAKEETSSLLTSHWALSMAKLANQLVSTPKESCTKEIDRSLDLVEAQRMLLEHDSLEDAPPQAPEQLVKTAVSRLQQAEVVEDQIRFALIGLAVCAAMTDGQAANSFISVIWAETLRLDSSQWNKWLQTEPDFTSPELRQKILRDTVFGALLMECRKDNSMYSVTYGRHVERTVIEKVGGTSQDAFSKLLQCVTAVDDSMQAQSLVVAKY